MLKPLTPEGRFECGLDALVDGKVWAFVAVPGQAYGAALGVAVADEPGYHPIPEVWCHGDTHAEVRAHAEALNTAARPGPPRRGADRRLQHAPALRLTAPPTSRLAQPTLDGASSFSSAISKILEPLTRSAPLSYFWTY